MYLGLFVSKTTHINIRIPAYLTPARTTKTSRPKTRDHGRFRNSIGRRYVPSAPPHGTPSRSFSSSPPYVPLSSPASCDRVPGLALPQQQQSQQSHFRRCVATLLAAMALFTNHIFSAIPPPLKIRFNCPKHPSRNLGGLPSSWMMGGAHIDLTALDLDQLWMLIHNTDPIQAKPPHQCPSNSF